MQRKIKRIAIVSSSFPPLGGGGVSTSHFNLFRAFKNRDCLVKAFTFGDGGKTRISRDENVVRAGPPLFLVKIINLLVFIFFRIIGEKGVVYQFADTIRGSLGGLLLIRRIKRFNPDMIILPDHGAPGVFLPRFKDCKNILISHHNPIRFNDEPLFGMHSAKDAQLALKLEQVVLAKVDGVICPSRYMKEMFSRTYFFSGPVEVIPNLLDTQTINKIAKTSLHEEAGLSIDAPIVYIPSAGSVFKGSQFVFEIIRRLASRYEKDVGFYLSGKISVELARTLDFVPPNARLIMPGQVSYEENIGNIRSCTICVSPTLIENFGMAILEAQLCGLPAVVFDVGGIRDIVVEGKTGYLVPFMDMEKLVAISKKLLFDRQLSVQIGTAAAKLLVGKFNADLVINRVISFLEKL